MLALKPSSLLGRGHLTRGDLEPDLKGSWPRLPMDTRVGVTYQDGGHRHNSAINQRPGTQTIKVLVIILKVEPIIQHGCIK